MKTVVLITFFLIPFLSYSQIEEDLIMKADSILETILQEINPEKTFKYNCEKSNEFINNTYWYDCQEYSNRQKRLKRKELKRTTDINYEIAFDLFRFDTISEFVKIRFDKNWNLISTEGIDDPESLLLLVNSKIDISNVKKIATDNNFSNGCIAWKINLKYEEEFSKYCWNVVNTIDLGDNLGCNSEGEILYIDAITGEIISIKKWQTECL
ncbi:MAG: hypothetical protein PHE33_11815 [Bacteroidales bacterium]|nr:hypothetical protein [Bacteroidales bacterium]